MILSGQVHILRMLLLGKWRRQCWRSRIWKPKRWRHRLRLHGTLQVASVSCFWKFNNELNRCYACVNVDYGADYNELSYEAFFSTADDGSRQIDCSSNAQQNGDSLCSCDAKFAQRIVQTENHCDVSFFFIIFDNFLMFFDKFWACELRLSRLFFPLTLF